MITEPEALTAEDHARLTKCLKDMDAAACAFYTNAVAIGNHAFIEFCGLMREYVSACRAALAQGIDFTRANRHVGEHLPVEPHFVNYLGEKLECIYGADLARAALDRATKQA